MGSKGIAPATDEYATVTKNDTALILHTGTKPYELDSDFVFSKKKLSHLRRECGG